LLCVLLLAATLPVPASGEVARTVRISVTTDGAQANGGRSMSTAHDGLSRHGRFVSFESDATNLSGDENQLWDHGYVRDRDADGDRRLDESGATRTVRVDVSTNGVPAQGTTFGAPVLSENGRFAAFSSNAWNLIDGEFDLNNTSDIFVRDRDTDRDRVLDEPGAVKTVRVSLSSSGAVPDYYCQDPAISASGRFVAFHSLASTLVEDDTNLLLDVFVRDRDTDRDGIFDEPEAVATTRMSVAADGTEGNGDSGDLGGVSGNGRFVVFDSIASNLVPGDTNGSWDVFVRDRDTDRDGIMDEPGAVGTIRVSTSAAGEEANATSVSGGMSRTGRFVAVQSLATNLVDGDTNGTWDAFVRDRDTDRDGIFDEPDAVATVRVSLSTEGAEANAASWGVSLSGNGRFVSFGSTAGDLVPVDTNNGDAFVRDRDTDRDGIFDEPGAVSTFLVGLTQSGSQLTRDANGVQLSTDGRWAIFNSDANDVVVPDQYAWNTDVFVRGPLH
jgi:hypothetical protein